MNIYEKLSEARIRLQSMNLKKSGKNKFAGFSYYELADFIPAINRIFNELKLYSMFSVESDKAILDIVNAENPEEHAVFTSPTATVDLKGCTAIQAIGAIHTYMKRYLYLNALEIVEHDALDAVVGKSDNNDENKFHCERTIGNVKDINNLNKAYKFFVDNFHNDHSWKEPLALKASELKASFNKESRSFEQSH